MNTLHSRAVIDNLVKAAPKGPQVKIRGYAALSNDSARIYAEVSGINRNDEQAVGQAVGKLLQERLHSVSGSFTILAENGISNYVTGIVTANREIVAVSDQDLQGYRCLSGNMYIDTEDKLWVLRANDAGKLMIRTDSLEDIEAMEQLMQSVSSSTPIGQVSAYGGAEDLALASFSSVLGNVDGGSFVNYLCPVAGTLKFGVVLASVVEEETEESNDLLVMASDADTYTKIDRQAVTDVVTVDQTKLDDQAFDSVSGVNIETLVAYYRSMFRRNTQYFAEFEKRLRSHFA